MTRRQNLGENDVNGQRACSVRPLPHDKLPMPPYNGVWCDDGGDLTQDLPSQPLPPDRQPAPIGTGELQSLLTQLPSKDPNFFHHTREGLPLLMIQPAG